MATERTLVLVKPDGVQRGLVGEVLARFERKGLKIVGLRLLHVSRALAERHYAVHEGKHFYAGLVEFITSGPVAAVALEGPDAIAVVRRMVGGTMPGQAEPGTIRGDLGLSGLRNLIHASDAAETAEAELDLWFDAGSLVDYGRAVDPWIVAEEPAAAAAGSSHSPSTTQRRSSGK
jgi:nucleoside-diphosphate kinase